MEYDDLLTDTIKEMYEITDKKCEIDVHDYDSNLKQINIIRHLKDFMKHLHNILFTIITMNCVNILKNITENTLNLEGLI